MDAVNRPPPHPPYTLLGLLLWGPTDPLSPSGSSSRGFAAGIDASLFLSIYLERGAVALQWLGLVLVTVFLLRRLSELLRLWVAARSIPGPSWGSSFGDTRVRSKDQDVNDYLLKMHERYGSIVKIWLSPTELMVSLKDPEDIRDVLVNLKDKFPLFGRALRLAFGRCCLFAPSYEEVKTRRELFEFNLNKRFIEKSKTLSFEVLKRVLERDHPVIFEQFLDCHSIYQRFAFYFMGATLFGSFFFLWQNAAIFEELLSVAEDANLLSSSKIPPIWRRRFWRHCWLCLKLRCLSLELVHQCAEKGNLSIQIYQHNTGNSAVFGLDDNATEDSCYEGIYQCLIAEEGCANIVRVMCHGFVRIASLIYHLLSRLVLQPELQEQIYTEINKFNDGGSGPNQYDVQHMQLLMETVYESIRLLPAGPLLQRYAMKQGINLRSGVTIPEGALLVVPAQVVQKDHSFWGNNACQFTPQRFLSVADGYSTCDAEVQPSVDLDTRYSCRDARHERAIHDTEFLWVERIEPLHFSLLDLAHGLVLVGSLSFTKSQLCLHLC